MTTHLEEIRRAMAEADCLASPEQVNNALDQMASAITAELADTNPLVYTVMNGGLIIAGRLLARLDFPLEVSYLHATRYGHQLEGNSLLDWRVRPTQEIKGRTVWSSMTFSTKATRSRRSASICRKKAPPAC